MKKLTLILAFTFYLAACSHVPRKDSLKHQLIQYQWVLIELGNITFEEFESTGGTSLITVDSDMNIHGLLGCYQFSSTAELQGHKMKINQVDWQHLDDLAQTSESCELADSNNEDRIHQKLQHLFLGWLDVNIDEFNMMTFTHNGQQAVFIGHER